MLNTRLIACILLGISVALLPIAQTSSAWAETIHFGAKLSADAEVPPTSSDGSGRAQITYDTDTRQLTFTVTYQDLTGPVTAAHIHGPAQSGASAGVLINFVSLSSPIRGRETLTDSQEKALLAQELYVNIHTQQNMQGEIRGQLLRQGPR